MVRNKINLSFLLILAQICLVSKESTTCKMSETLLTKDTEPQCVSCPENCQICYPGLQNKLICGFCMDNFYMNVFRKCKPCVENCESCVGKSQKMCVRPAKGYFYDQAENKLANCKMEGCAYCPNKTECINCDEGYYVANRKMNEEKLNVVECKKCEIDNCKFCREIED